MFGELLHADGAYIHDLSKDWLFNKNAYADMWRLKESAKRNGSLYPTHGLGPIAQCLDINRGDRMDYLVSVSTNDFTLGAMASEMAAKDDFFKEYVGKNYRGNMNATTVRTVKGKTMMIQHDVTPPRPYSRIHVLSGTKGAASKWPSPERIAFGHSWVKPEELKNLYEKYSPPIIKHIGEIAKEVGGYGGMDWVGDNRHTWSYDDRGLEAALADILHSARLGYCVIGSDVAGYHGRSNPDDTGPATSALLNAWKTPANSSSASGADFGSSTDDSIAPNLYIRWAQFSTFCGLFLNGGHGERRLWKRSRPGLEIIRKFSWLHTELVPYMYSHVVECHNGGLPLMRPQPRGKFHYLFGGDLLVAPIHSDQTEYPVSLPAGRWRSIHPRSARPRARRRLVRPGSF